MPCPHRGLAQAKNIAVNLREGDVCEQRKKGFGALMETLALKATPCFMALA